MWSVASVSTPASISTRTQSARPPRAAQINAVYQRLVLASVSAPPFNSRRTHSAPIVFLAFPLASKRDDEAAAAAAAAVTHQLMLAATVAAAASFRDTNT